jgi:AraC family transcriptional regulator, positive regulator of tynA and feaB
VESTIERWSLADHPATERSDAWRAAITGTHLSWELHTDRWSAYPATNQIRRRSVGAVRFVECTTGPCSGVRGSRLRSVDEEHIGVLFVLEGSEIVAKDDVEMQLAAGSVAVWDSTHRMRFMVPDAVRKQTLLIPRARAAELAPDIDRLGGTVLPPSSATRVLRDLFTSIIDEVDEVEIGHGDASSIGLVNAALELLAGALTATPAGLARDDRSQRWADVRNVIEEHLGDPTLSPASIAHEAAVSVRALYLLFESHGDTVARYVKRRRLARARSELERRRDLTLASVAQRWGFNDQAAFSRAFRAQYGVTPGQARNAVNGSTG